MLGFSVYACCSLTSPMMIFSSPLSFFFPNMLILIDHMCLIKIVWWKGCGHFRHLTFLLPSIVGYLWVLSSRSFERTAIHSYLNNPPIFPSLSLIIMQMEKQVHDLKHSHPLSTSVSTPLPFSLPLPSLSHFLSALHFPSPLLCSLYSNTNLSNLCGWGEANPGD